MILDLILNLKVLVNPLIIINFKHTAVHCTCECENIQYVTVTKVNKTENDNTVCEYDSFLDIFVNVS